MGRKVYLDFVHVSTDTLTVPILINLIWLQHGSFIAVNLDETRLTEQNTN